MTPEQLDDLHTILGHLARQLWDLQKARICAGNRVAAMERDQIAPETMEVSTTVKFVVVDELKSVNIVDALKSIESTIESDVRKAIRQHPLASWIEAQRGIGLPTFANLLGVTGNIGRFETVSKLWKYLGLHVTPDKTAPKKKKGESWTHTDCQIVPDKHQNDHPDNCPKTCTTEHHPNCRYGVKGTAYSPKGRTICYMLGEAIVKVGGDGPYRAAYDAKKAYYEAERPDWSQMHRHKAAMRYAAKELIKALWIEWHRVLKPERLEEWEARERERVAVDLMIPIRRMPPTPESRYDYALPVGAR